MNSYQRKTKEKIKLQIENVNSTYESLEVIQDINMHVHAGEFVSILGPSGCGKSTLFNIVAGLLKPQSGKVFIDEVDVTGKTNLVSYMYQKDLLLPWKKVIDNVALPYIIQGTNKKEARKKVEKYFEAFGLSGFEDYYPSQLSGGMKQRAAMMRTYMNNHQIMLLDEPFGRLDAITKRKMQQWLKKVSNKYNRSILFITHDIDEALYLSDRIYVLSDRPAKVVKEFKINMDQSDFLACTTSEAFNQLKTEITLLLNTF